MAKIKFVNTPKIRVGRSETTEIEVDDTRDQKDERSHSRGYLRDSLDGQFKLSHFGNACVRSEERILCGVAQSSFRLLAIKDQLKGLRPSKIHPRTASDLLNPERASPESFRYCKYSACRLLGSRARRHNRPY